MLHYAIVFFVIAIIAGILGFSSVMGTAAWIAKLFFVGFLIVAIISLLMGGRTRTDL